MKPESLKLLTVQSIRDTTNRIKTSAALDGLASIRLFDMNKREDKAIVKNLARKTVTASADCAAYLIEKLPFDNDILLAFRGLDPAERCTERSVTNLGTLAQFFSDGVDRDPLKYEIRQYAADEDIETLCSSVQYADPFRLDEYWYAVGNLTDSSGVSRYIQISSKLLDLLSRVLTVRR